MSVGGASSGGGASIGSVASSGGGCPAEKALVSAAVTTELAPITSGLASMTTKLQMD